MDSVVGEDEEAIDDKGIVNKFPRNHSLLVLVCSCCSRKEKGEKKVEKEKKKSRGGGNG